jgi:predicted AlkP superfamily phosphohydrolase/phosphomutase
MEELEAVEHPTTGQSPVEDAYTFEQVYTGQGNYSPDIIVDQSKGWHIAGGIGHAKVFSESHSWKAENKRNGIFVFYGEEFQTDKKINEIEILDIAPTLCHMYDLPIPEEMDGQVCSAVFSEESTAATREPQWESIKTEYMNRRAEFNNDAKDRLTDLGYL